MSAQNQAAVVATELEKVRNKIEPLFNADFGLFSKIQKSVKAEKVSMRAMRLPIAVAPSGGISQVNPDAATGSFGRGTSTQYQPATFTPVFLAKVMELTREAQVATDSSEQAISNSLKQGLKDAMTSFKVGIEQLLQTDGSGTLGQVGSIAGQVITLATGDNANAFVVQQVIQVFPALGGTSRGTFNVVAQDAIGHTVTADALPAGTVAGDLLIIAGGTGVAGSSLYGLPYLVNGAKSGTYLGLSRAAYNLSSAHVNGTGDTFSYALSRQVLNYIRMQIGVDKSQDIIWHMPLAQSAALDSVVIQNTNVYVDPKSGVGGNTVDLQSKDMIRTLAGRPVIESTHATSSRVDALSLESWVRGEVVAPQLLDTDGTTLYTSYGSDGGVGMSSMAIVWAGFQIAVQNPLAQGFIDNLVIPTGY